MKGGHFVMHLLRSSGDLVDIADLEEKTSELGVVSDLSFVFTILESFLDIGAEVPSYRKNQSMPNIIPTW